MWGILVHTSAYQILLVLSFFALKEDVWRTGTYKILLKLSLFALKEDVGHTGAY
jgi:hypothetical protein